MKKNILICLEKMDIGGIETFVYNQTISFLKKGYNVIILSDKGIYSDAVKKLGAKFINFKYDLKNDYDNSGIKKVSQIIKENDITEVHIHQYPCLLSVLPAAIKNDVPYVAYVHSIVDRVFEWFIDHYEIYNDLFKVYFKYSSKIIAITNTVKERLNNLYEMTKYNCIVINNCIDIENINVLSKVDEISNFLIVSRLSEEKEISIKNGIKLFKRYREKKQGCILNIVGDGIIRTKLEKFVNENNLSSCVNFVGATNDVFKYINLSDVVIGVDRCILEAIAYNRIAIISGYKELKGIVNENNIALAASENFSGNNMDDLSIDEIVYQLLNLKNFESIVKHNKNYIIKNLNIDNQNYTINKDTHDYKNINLFFDLHIKYINIYNENLKLYKKEYDLGQEILKLQEINSKLLENSNELNNIKNSKRWKLVNKLFNLKNRLWR